MLDTCAHVSLTRGCQPLRAGYMCRCQLELAALQVLDVAESSLQGTLPAEWGQGPQAFPALRVFNASQTQLSGPLPSAWGTAGAFPRLTNLTLVNTRISGTLPDSWAGAGVWPALLALQIDQTNVSGSWLWMMPLLISCLLSFVLVCAFRCHDKTL